MLKCLNVCLEHGFAHDLSIFFKAQYVKILDNILSTDYSFYSVISFTQDVKIFY